MARSGVTAPKGFLAAGISAGIKKTGKKDLALIYSQFPCVLAGVTTQNRVAAAPIILARETITRGRAQAVIVNSGNANACTGEDGLERAKKVRKALAKELGITEDMIIIASTGIIGVPYPEDKVIKVLPQLKNKLTGQGGLSAAQAIMTTDLAVKQVVNRIPGTKALIGGMAKGSGMIHPNMATMLGFLTTDATIDPIALQKALWEATDLSFNMISVDGDTSTNDIVTIMANGAVGGRPIREGTKLYESFRKSLIKTCITLAQAIVKDGEGAKKIFEVHVKGAPHKIDANKIAKTIITSPLVKTAIAGGDNNWGRVIAAAGRAGVIIDPDKITVELKDLKKRYVRVIVDLKLGNAEAIAWGCDLTEGYIKINTHYN
jgi:glutamate N-acetyltransferase/amino-acid N-acetyltransferase